MDNPNNKFMITGVWYDRAKWFVQLFLPSLGSFYYGLTKIFEWSGGEQVLAVCALIATFVGAILQISTKNYYNSDKPYDGQMVVSQDPNTGKQTFSLEVNADPEDLKDQKMVSFKVTGSPSMGNYEELNP